MSDSPEMTRVRLIIGQKLDEISQLFNPGSKMTIVVRAPYLEDGDLVMTNDNLESAIASLQWAVKKEVDARGGIRSE